MRESGLMAATNNVLTVALGLALLALPLYPSVRVRLLRMLHRAYSDSITVNGIARARARQSRIARKCTVFDALIVLTPVFALPVLLLQPRPVMPTLGLGIVLLVLALFDLRYRWLPNALTLPLLPAGLLLAALLEREGEVSLNMSAAGIIVAGGSVWLVAEAFRRLRGVDGIGGGDIKLIAGMGAWLGPSGAATVIAIAGLTAFAVEITAQWVATGRIDSGRRIPFGVYLAGAFWLVWCGRDYLAWP